MKKDIVIPDGEHGRVLGQLRERLASDRAGCWVWQGSLVNGYGSARVGGQHYVVHRLMWVLIRGPLLPELDLDHLCRNRACANPDHLEPVTHAENLRRSDETISAQRRRQTHCKNGHAYAEHGRPRRDGGRDCRACLTEANRRYRARKRAARLAGTGAQP